MVIYGRMREKPKQVTVGSMGRRIYFWIRRHFESLDRAVRFLFNSGVTHRLRIFWGYIRIGVLARLRPGYRKPLKIAGLNIAFNKLSLLRDVYTEIFIDRLYSFDSDKPNPRIIDAGANLGDSLLYYKYAYPKSTVICFEPDPYNCEIIKRNITLNELSDVELYEVALSDQEGTAKLYFNSQSEGDTAQSLSKDFRASLADEPELGTREVRTVSLRSYLKKPVDILKMDIEGAEGIVLPDIADLLPNVSCIQMEYHYESTTTRLQDILRIIEDADFRYRILPLQPLENVPRSVAMIYAYRPGAGIVPTPKL